MGSARPAELLPRGPALQALEPRRRCWSLQALLLGVLNFKHPTLGYIHRESKVGCNPS